jgi:hypothetical protein
VISGADFEAGFAKLIQQLQSAPAAPAPVPLSTPSEPPPQPAPQRTEPDESMPISAPMPEIPAPTPEIIVAEPPVANQTQQTIVSELASVELPSVWDDPPPSDQPAAPQTTADLAQRLGVTGQVLNRRRSLATFASWSQTHDPQGLCWVYNSSSKMFDPLEAPESSVEITVESSPAQPDSDQKAAEIKSALTNGAGGAISEPKIEQIQESLPLADATEPQDSPPQPPESGANKRSQKSNSTKGQRRSPP